MDGFYVFLSKYAVLYMSNAVFHMSNVAVYTSNSVFYMSKFFVVPNLVVWVTLLS